MNGYTPAFLHKGNWKLVRDENNILEKVFWKMFFATRDIKEIEEEFWLTNFMITTNMKGYFLKEN